MYRYEYETIYGTRHVSKAMDERSARREMSKKIKEDSVIWGRTMLRNETRCEYVKITADMSVFVNADGNLLVIKQQEA